MADEMQKFVTEAKKNKFSAIGVTLSDEDVASVWDNVSAFVDKQMSQQKGVHIHGLGTFTFSQEKLDVGNNKFVLMQRPILALSEKFLQNHGLKYTKHHVSGNIPVVPLNYAALSIESPFDRDTVESCTREVLGALQRSVASKKNVEFTFQGIGRLQIRDSKVKMKFYKEFVNSMDGSGQAVQTMKDRPGTVDSVMTERAPSRPHTSNTMVLPRINGNLTLGPEVMPTVEEEEERLEEPKLSEDLKSCQRATAPLAVATGVSFNDDVFQLRTPSPPPPMSSPTPVFLKRSLSPIPDAPTPRLDSDDVIRAKSGDELLHHSLPFPDARAGSSPERPQTAGSCSHPNAGQELCYLCHQRARRNIPVYFTEERRKREEEEDKFLQQYQHVKDTEAILQEQEHLMGKKHNNQKVAAFNVGVADAVKTKKAAKDSLFYPSYVFQRRALTPPRFIKQDLYAHDLEEQMSAQNEQQVKHKADQDFLERLEQVQLVDDLAAQREQYLRDRSDQREQYKRALSSQVRFKPAPLPASVPDSTGPVFGKNDMNNEKMMARRRQAHNLYQEQVSTVEGRKRAAIVKRLHEQKEEDEMLKRNRDEILDDRADRYRRIIGARKHLESEWFQAADTKKKHDVEERDFMRKTGMLLHEQCDRYKRCDQCKRQTQNCGESNIWRESRYIPGSRIMV